MSAQTPSNHVSLCPSCVIAPAEAVIIAAVIASAAILFANFLDVYKRQAYQLFSFLYGESILNKLNVHELQPNAIVLSPTLLRK